MRKTKSTVTQAIIDKYGTTTIVPPMTISKTENTVYHAKDHPVSIGETVEFKRIIAWEYLGQPDFSPCTYCGYQLSWLCQHPLFKSFPEARPFFRVCISHSNRDEKNIRPRNLDPTCIWCHQALDWAPYAPDYLYRLVAAYKSIPPIARPKPPSPLDTIRNFAFPPSSIPLDPPSDESWSESISQLQILAQNPSQ